MTTPVDNSKARDCENFENILILQGAGTAVFPCSQGKLPLIKAFNRLDTDISADERAEISDQYAKENDGKKPRFIGATKDLKTLKRMKRAFPNCLWSIATGPSHFVVCDADQKNNGPAQLDALYAAHGGQPEGVVRVKTQSGGYHDYYADPRGEFTNRAGALHDLGVDIRGTGGQTVAPGMWLENGRRYGTHRDVIALARACANKKLPELPDFMVERIARGSGKIVDDKATPSREREVIAALQNPNVDWEQVHRAFDEVEGKYALSLLRSRNPKFADLYENPGADTSDNRFKITRILLKEWPEMTALELSHFYSTWAGSGSRVDEGKPSTGEYDDRGVAREWLKNTGQDKPSDGSAFGPVDDEDDGPVSVARRIDLPVNLNNPGEMVARVENILISREVELYRRGHSLVQVVVDRPLPGLDAAMPTAQLQPVNSERLAQLTGTHINFQRWDGRRLEFVGCAPPRDLMAHCMSRGVTSQLQRISGVSATPMIRPDGSILSTPGYDPATEIYLLGGLDLPEMIEHPTRDDALAALELVAGLFSECAFADRGEGPYGSVGVAAVLSVIIGYIGRLLIPGIPMLTCTAATPGSGKSYIGTLIGILLTGRAVPVSSVAAGFSAELDKRLTAGLLAGAPIVHLDNCNGKLDSELLCQMLTQSSVAIRPLGVSEEVIVSGLPLVLANGNGVQVDENLARRTLLVELDAGMEKPELRSFNLSPDRILLNDRGVYVAAILTALRAYLLALKTGEAKLIQPKLGSFDQWSDYSRSMLVWLGYRDPVEATAIAQAEDPDKSARRAVFGSLRELFSDRPFTVGKLVERLQAAEYDALDERPQESRLCNVIQENLRTLLPNHKSAFDTKALGNLFRTWVTKVEMGLTLKRVERNSANVTTYAVVLALS
jgi:hypothetical protein